MEVKVGQLWEMTSVQNGRLVQFVILKRRSLNDGWVISKGFADKIYVEESSNNEIPWIDDTTWNSHELMAMHKIILVIEPPRLKNRFELIE